MNSLNKILGNKNKILWLIEFVLEYKNGLMFTNLLI